MQNIRSDSHAASAPLSPSSLASFDPKAYLREYYSRLGEENKALLHFHCKAYACIFGEVDTARMLEFGGGPTIYQLISAAKYPVAIDFSDYLDVNLKELNV